MLGSLSLEILYEIQVQLCTPVILALRRLRQENCSQFRTDWYRVFHASLSYIQRNNERSWRTVFKVARNLQHHSDRVASNSALEFALNILDFGELNSCR